MGTKPVSMGVSTLYVSCVTVVVDMVHDVEPRGDGADWQAVLWRLCLGGRVQRAGTAAPAPGLSRTDRLAVYAATARIMRVVLLARVRLIATERRPPAADLAIWRSYPEFATRL